ncbi:MAG: hypothetical protein ACKPKO_40905, partial [Candidatus Fonsibacter sp.]
TSGLPTLDMVRVRCQSQPGHSCLRGGTAVEQKLDQRGPGRRLAPVVRDPLIHRELKDGAQQNMPKIVSILETASTAREADRLVHP